MSIPRKDFKVDELIDDKAPLTIYSSRLKPHLANAALNLTIDFERQKQSIANRYILKHPYTLGTVLISTSIFAYWRLAWIYQRGGWTLLKQNTEEFFPIIVFFTMFISVFFTIVSKPTEIIKNNADYLVEDSNRIFGFDLKEFIRITPKDKKFKELESKSENTSIIVYRDTPIAIVTLIPGDSLSDSSKLIVKITGIGVRKVYYKSGMIDDLFDWVKYRVAVLNQDKKASHALILIDVLSVDHEFKKKLKGQEFQYIGKESPVSNSKILNFYGINYESWGLGLSVQKAEKIKSKIGSTGSKK